MRNEKSNNAENVNDDNEKDRISSHITNPDDEISLHASSQDSLMNEIQYVVDEANGSSSNTQVSQSSEKLAGMKSRSSSKLNGPNSSPINLKTSEDASVQIGGEGAVEDDDEVIIVTDSPRKEEPSLPALEKIEEAVKTLKNAFLHGEEELNKSVREINRLKEEQETLKELITFKKGSLDALKRSVEDDLFGTEVKRAKVDSKLVAFEQEISSLESKIREGKQKERMHRRHSELIQKVFLKYPSSYEELMAIN